MDLNHTAFKDLRSTTTMKGPGASSIPTAATTQEIDAILDHSGELTPIFQDAKKENDFISGRKLVALNSVKNSWDNMCSWLNEKLYRSNGEKAATIQTEPPLLEVIVQQDEISVAHPSKGIQHLLEVPLPLNVTRSAKTISAIETVTLCSRAGHHDKQAADLMREIFNLPSKEGFELVETHVRKFMKGDSLCPVWPRCPTQCMMCEANKRERACRGPGHMNIL